MTKEILQDETLIKIQEEAEKDNAIVENVIGKVIEILNQELSADNDFYIKHGYMVIGRVLVYLSQALCKDEAMFIAELEKAREIAVNRMIDSVLPKVEDGKIVEEGYDMENLSIRRIMMSLGTAVDYALWKTEMSQYQNIRKDMEVQEQVKEQEEK